MIFDDRRVRILLWVAVGLVAVGFYAFVLRGASQPADPVLGAPAPGVTNPDQPLPGDPLRVPLTGFDELAVTVEPAGAGDLLSWCLLAALNTEQRARGLMEVTDLQGYPGMAFLYAQDTQNQFHMRNTPMPLSIAWIDADGALVSTADMDPCTDRDDCPLYRAARPYRMAIEVPRGGLEDLGIGPGARVSVSGACAPRAGGSTG